MRDRIRGGWLLVAAAVIVGGGTAAVAASRGGGVIHACASTKTGALSLQHGRHCGRGTKAVSWNQTGPRGQTGPAGHPGQNGQNGQNGQPGANGQNGATNVVVRTGAATIPLTCSGSGPYFCSGTGSGSVACNGGERAVGGGYDSSGSGGQSTISATRPNPASGTPTGWFISLSYSNPSAATVMANVQIPIYVDCAAP